MNTHHHADHTFGNFTLGPETTIVAHRAARDEVIATGTGIANAFAGPDWGDIEVTPPFLCFEDQITLFVDDLECHLIHFGTPAHTTNDIVVWIPDRKIMFMCGPESFAEVAAYLRFLQDTARRGFEAGLEPLELAREVDLGEFADLSDSERIVGNLHRAYSELRGEERGVALPLPPIVAEIQEYLGGPIVSHA